MFGSGYRLRPERTRRSRANVQRAASIHSAPGGVLRSKAMSVPADRVACYFSSVFAIVAITCCGPRACAAGRLSRSPGFANGRKGVFVTRRWKRCVWFHSFHGHLSRHTSPLHDFPGAARRAGSSSSKRLSAFDACGRHHMALTQCARARPHVCRTLRSQPIIAAKRLLRQILRSWTLPQLKSIR